MAADQGIVAHDGAAAGRVIAHADMDAFYAAVEQLDNPELRGKPVIVGGNSARGVVTTASYEARKFGVHSAMPTVQARRLCPDGIFVRGRMKRYVEVSRVVRRIFESMSPAVEPLSLDEAFIDLTGTDRLFGHPIEAARMLKQRVHDETGLAVSVGVAPTKMAAKMLSDMSKPDGLLYIDAADLTEFLRPLPVGRLWGVGRVTQERLHAANIATVGDLANRDVADLKARFGSMGMHLYELANGRDPRGVIADWQRKSYGEENTFERDHATEEDAVIRAIIAHSDALGRRLRADSVRARTVTLKLKLAKRAPGAAPGRYPLISRSFSLERATDDGAEICAIARGLLAAEARRGPIRLIGVQVHNLERVDAAQLGLFDALPEETSKRQRLNSALDRVAQRFGADVVTRGLAHAERAAPTTRMK
ncbi:MAG: DNA polymerase IV [Candidatus Binataceae bacterium]